MCQETEADGNTAGNGSEKQTEQFEMAMKERKGEQEGKLDHTEGDRPEPCGPEQSIRRRMEKQQRQDEQVLRFSSVFTICSELMDPPPATVDASKTMERPEAPITTEKGQLCTTPHGGSVCCGFFEVTLPNRRLHRFGAVTSKFSFNKSYMK